MTIARDRWQQNLKSSGHYYPEHRRRAARAARAAPRRRRRYRGPRLPGARRRARSLPRRPPHQEPARAAAARRADRIRGVRGQLRRPRGGSPRRRPSPKGRPPVRSGDSCRDEPRVRPRSRAQGGLRRAALGGSAPEAQPLPGPFESSLGLDAVSAAQAGLVADMDQRRRRPLRAHRLIVPDPGTSQMSPNQPVPHQSAANRPSSPIPGHPQPVAIVGISAIMPEAPTAAAFWDNIKSGPLLHHRRSEGPVGSGSVLRQRPACARQDLLAHRRVGPRVPVGAPQVAAADSAEGCRADGRRPEVGRLGGTLGAHRRGLAEMGGRPGAGRRGARQRDRR